MKSMNNDELLSFEKSLVSDCCKAPVKSGFKLAQTLDKYYCTRCSIECKRVNPE